MLPAQTTHSPQSLIIGVPGVPACLSDCASGADFTLTPTRGCRSPTCDPLCTEPSLGPANVTAQNIPLPRGLSPCAQLSSCFPREPRSDQLLLSVENKLGEEEMVGNPGRRWEHPQVQSPGVPAMSSPGSGPLAEMLTDGSMLTLPQLSASLTVKDQPPAPVPWSTDLPH